MIDTRKQFQLQTGVFLKRPDVVTFDDMKLVSNLFVQIFALFSSYFISIDADSIISFKTPFFMAPPRLLVNFSCPITRTVEQSRTIVGGYGGGTGVKYWL